MKRRGFTLIETILVIVIISIIAGVTGRVLSSGIDTYSLITSRRNALDHARVAMDRMVTELQGINPLTITWMANTRLIFLNQNLQLIKYNTATTSGYNVLTRNDYELAGNVSYLDFDYLKADGSNALWTFWVKKINIELAVQTVGGYGTVSLRTEIFPRGLMYNSYQ